MGVEIEGRGKGHENVDKENCGGGASTNSGQVGQGELIEARQKSDLFICRQQ